MIERKVYWTGGVPEFDDFGDKIGSTFIDGRTTQGPWAFMTPKSYSKYGTGIGQGKGQCYNKQADGKWLKVDG